MSYGVIGTCDMRELGGLKGTSRGGRITKIRVMAVGKKRPLTATEQKHFETLVRAKAEDIVEKWIAFFVHHRDVSTEIITKK